MIFRTNCFEASSRGWEHSSFTCRSHGNKLGRDFQEECGFPASRQQGRRELV